MQQTGTPARSLPPARSGVSGETTVLRLGDRAPPHQKGARCLSLPATPPILSNGRLLMHDVADQRVDVVPVLAIAVAERQMRIEIAGEIMQPGVVPQGNIMAAGNQVEPARILIWDGQELGADLLDGILHHASG